MRNVKVNYTNGFALVFAAEIYLYKKIDLDFYKRFLYTNFHYNNIDYRIIIIKLSVPKTTLY